MDVAGIGQAAHGDGEKREGLSAEFIGHIRNADALAIVLRTFENSNVPHIYSSIDPNRDLDSLNAELALTDLATVEKRIERTKKAAKSGDKKYQQELDILQLLQEALNDLRPVSSLELLAQDRAVLSELFLLTLKPRMYVLNVSEDALGAASNLLERIAAGEDVDLNKQEGELRGIAIIAKRGKAEGAEVATVSARLEAELAELPEEDAAEYLEIARPAPPGRGSRHPGGLSPAQPDYLPDGWRGRSARLDGDERREGPRSRRQDSLRYRARLHSRRSDALRGLHDLWRLVRRRREKGLAKA